MHPKSSTLFHFTKTRETLKQILKNGLWPKYCLEDVSWLGYPAYEYIAYPMVCFCDIPLSRISEHVKFYGNFGIGLTREWAESHGLNPVLYVAGKNHVTSSFIELNEHAHKQASEDLRESTRVTMRYLLAHSKPAQGKMVANGLPIEKAFYQESEWRYVPKNKEIRAYLIKEEFESVEFCENENQKTKTSSTIKFKPRDIRYIFVKSDNDIPDIVNFIQAEMDEHSGIDQKILLTRVVSLESLSSDL